MKGVCIYIEISHSVLYMYNHSMSIKIKIVTKMWLKILPYLSFKKLTKCESRQNINIVIYISIKLTLFILLFWRLTWISYTQHFLFQTGHIPK